MSQVLSRPADTRLAFAQCFNRLAVALRLPTKDIDRAQIEIYFEALADLPLWAVVEAARHLERHGGSFFPTAAVWHQAAEDLIAQRQRQQTGPVLDQRESECMVCDDTGWEVLRCNGTTCGRRVDHPAHTETRACACRATNTRYQRRHQVVSST